MKLAGKTIWITGASSGVGEGMARVFHREGATLILSGRRHAELQRVRGSCTGPAPVHVVAFDLTDAAARERAAADVLARCPRIDVLVNNAGIGQRSAALDTRPEVERRIMEIDYFAPVMLTKLVLPRMIAQGGGHLVVTSSVAGRHAVPHHSSYCAAKHALHGYFDTLRVEHHADKIDVTMLVIAGVKSNVFQHALTGDGSEYGASTWDNSGGMPAEECAERVLNEGLIGKEYELVIGIETALQALKISRSDPRAFVERMTGMMRWMKK
ncbi:MAG: SDR family NAD(P)-dependent oxidoreductase [Gammaproteobacteria bacterium]|nr:SDR family NAD(P)-dependent oxidoreductase [Gammaproteobacteria bacterium]